MYPQSILQNDKQKKCFLQNSDYINGKREKRKKKNEATKRKMKNSKKKLFCRSRSISSVSVAPNNQRRAKNFHQEQLIKKNKSFTWGNFEFTTSYEIYNIAWKFARRQAYFYPLLCLRFQSYDCRKTFPVHLSAEMNWSN